MIFFTQIRSGALHEYQKGETISPEHYDLIPREKNYPRNAHDHIFIAVIGDTALVLSEDAVKDLTLDSAYLPQNLGLKIDKEEEVSATVLQEKFVELAAKPTVVVFRKKPKKLTSSAFKKLDFDEVKQDDNAIQDFLRGELQARLVCKPNDELRNLVNEAQKVKNKEQGSRSSGFSKVGFSASGNVVLHDLSKPLEANTTTLNVERVHGLLDPADNTFYYLKAASPITKGEQRRILELAKELI